MSKVRKSESSEKKMSYYVSSIHMSPLEEKEPGHLESSLDAIRELLPQHSDFEDYLEEMLKFSEEIEDNPHRNSYRMLNDPQNPVYLYRYVSYSLNEFLDFIALIKTEHDDFEVLSVSLSGVGCKKRLHIQNKYQWDNVYEGDVTADFYGKEICFIDPFYFNDRKKIKLNKPCDISLFAVALSCEPRDPESIEVNEGQFYEEMLKEFQQKNHDKAANGMQPLLISTKGMSLLEPHEYKSVYEYFAFILDVEEASVFDEKCFKCTVVT